MTKISSVRRLRACSSRDIGLMRMPMNGGSVDAFMPAATARAADRVAILLAIRPRAVAVLEIDPEVLDRLALELLEHARAHRSRKTG